MKLLIALLVSFFLFHALTYSQNVPGINNNITLLSQKHDYNVYSNIWGWTSPDNREYVLLGHNAGTSIIEITDPQNPVERDMVPGPTGGGTIWRELKTYSHYVYVVSEHTQPNSLSGVQIIDLSYLPDSVHLVQNYRWPGVTAASAKAHSISVDDSLPYLYIQGGNSTSNVIGADPGGIRVLSLADPENPTSVSTMAHLYVHDSYMRNGILFASNIYLGGYVDIWNISNRAQPRLIHSLQYPNGFSHNSAVSENNNFLYTTDEVSGFTMKTWDISNLWDNDTSNNDDIPLTSEYIGNPEEIAHNIHVNGSYGYLSHYVEGVKVLDLSNPAEPIEVGYYDTYQVPGSGFSGDWGVYPHFPSGNFVVSDIESGLYVFRFDTVAWGGVHGVVRNGQTGAPVSDAHLYFVEANKFTTSNDTGGFVLKSNAGSHQVIVSRLGFFNDTVEVELPAHAVTDFDIHLESENAFISVNPDSIGVYMNINDTTTAQFQIANVGTGTLYFSIDDINGPRKNKRVGNFDTRIMGKSLGEKLHARSFTGTENSVSPPDITKADLEILSEDPAGDVIGVSAEPDIRAIFGEKTATTIRFKTQFYHAVNVDSMTIGYALDTDQNPETGGTSIGIYSGDVGAEYDIFVTIPPITQFGIPARSVLVFNNINGGNPAVFPNAAQVGVDSSVTFSINLSSLANDDGNINLVGSAYHWADSIGTNPPTSLDFVPDEGHVALGYDPYGDITWLSLDVESDTIVGQGTRNVTLTFDATGLNDGETYRGILVIASNDAMTPTLHIPVVLETKDIVGVSEREQNRLSFSLEQNYPNPFNPQTAIGFSLLAVGNVTLKVYNVLGEEVATLMQNKLMNEGKHNVEFDASGLTSGVYLYRLSVSHPNESAIRYTQTKKLLLMK